MNFVQSGHFCKKGVFYENKTKIDIMYNLLYNFFKASTIKIIPTKAAKLSSVKRVKYLTKLDTSKATII